MSDPIILPWKEYKHECPECGRASRHRKRRCFYCRDRAKRIARCKPGRFWGRASANFFPSNTRKYGFGGEGRGY